MTLQGDSPTEESFTDDGKPQIKKIQADAERYQEISYVSHILLWLKSLSVSPMEHMLNNALSAYIYSVEKLTYQNQEDHKMRNKRIEDLLAFKQEEQSEIFETVHITSHLYYVREIYTRFSERKSELQLEEGYEIFYAHRQKICDDFNDLKKSVFGR